MLYFYYIFAGLNLNKQIFCAYKVPDTLFSKVWMELKNHN